MRKVENALLAPGLAVLALLCTMTRSALAAEYWVEPGASGDGSQQSPWGSLDSALETVEGGDTVWLLSGDYGELAITSIDHAPPVSLTAADGETPEFSRVTLNDSSGLTLRGLLVSGESAGTLMDISGRELLVEDCVLRSAEDTSDWSAQDWIDRASSGIEVSGTEITIRGNTLQNVGYGISVDATHSLIEANLIENFSRDGLRGLGDHTVFQYNTVKNCYAVDDHHDDGFQSWSVGDDGSVGTGEVVGIVLRGNTFINYEDADQPHRGTLQGIGCFDGTFVDWVVENNVVMTDHWHGITLLGARNCAVTNNTVIDLNTTSPGPPWISIDNHKDGTAPSACTVRNNLTTDLSNAGSVSEESNIVIDMSETDSYFVDTEAHDLHLVDDAPAIDAGASTDAPDLDRDGIARPQGDGIDVGAYEWHDGSITPSAGAAGMPPAGTTTSGSGGGVGESSTSTGSGSGGTSTGTAGGSGGTRSDTASTGGGASPGATETTGASPSDEGGCGCRARGSAGSRGAAVFLLLVAGLCWRQRRQGATRHSSSESPRARRSAVQPRWDLARGRRSALLCRS